MTKLTQLFRQTLAKRIVAHRFKNAIELAQTALAEAIETLYAHLYPEPVRAWMAAAPKGFLRPSTQVYVYRNGHHCCLQFATPRPLSYEHISAPLSRATVPPEALKLLDACLVHLEVRDKLRDEERELTGAVLTQLAQYRTLKQLRDGWPEIASFLPEEKEAGRAMIVPPTKLNALLGLPPT